jgi:hypothetical protein
MDNGTLSNAPSQCTVERLDSLQLKQHISQFKDLRHGLDQLDHPLLPLPLQQEVVAVAQLTLGLKKIREWLEELQSNQQIMVTIPTQPQMLGAMDQNSLTLTPV